MTIPSGYHRRYLRVDLSRPLFETVDLDDDFLDSYIGGRGFGAKLVWDNLVEHDFKIDPLGPENLIVIAPGPLSGAYLPSSGKCSFVAISPATGIYGDSSMGGGFGVELRQAGVDRHLPPHLQCCFLWIPHEEVTMTNTSFTIAWLKT